MIKKLDDPTEGINEPFARRGEDNHADWLNALALLTGYDLQSDTGISESKYIEENSSEEREARLSLARLLRSDKPLNHELRWALAALFDPESDGERQLVFKDQRQPGRTRDHRRNSQIFAFIKEWVEKGGPPLSKVRKSHQVHRRAVVGAAVPAASQKFNLSEEMIWKIYRRYRKLDKLPDENAKVRFYTRVVKVKP